MGNVSAMLVAVLFILAVVSMSGLMFVDAMESSPVANLQEYQTFNQTEQYRANMENQSNSLRQTLQAQQEQEVDPLTKLNLLLQGGATAVGAVLGLLGLPIALLFDLGNILGIPAFLTGMAMVGVVLLFVFQVIEALRTGRL